jgi:hypothetical protein
VGLSLPGVVDNSTLASEQSTAAQSEDIQRRKAAFVNSLENLKIDDEERAEIRQVIEETENVNLAANELKRVNSWYSMFEEEILNFGLAVQIPNQLEKLKRFSRIDLTNSSENVVVEAESAIVDSAAYELRGSTKIILRFQNKTRL